MPWKQYLDGEVLVDVDLCQARRAPWVERSHDGPDNHADQDMHQPQSLRLSGGCHPRYTVLILCEFDCLLLVSVYSALAIGLRCNTVLILQLSSDA